MIKLNAKELRSVDLKQKDKYKIKKNPITIVLDNILDTYNVGAIFRLADAVAAEKLYICGETETPPNHKIKKSSVDTWKWVDWEYAPTASSVISKLKKQSSIRKTKLKVIAVEQDPKSKAYYDVDYSFPLALVVGNETHGVNKDVLSMCDMIVEVPMWGVNKSLNVMVSLGLVLYKVMEKFY